MGKANDFIKNAISLSTQATKDLLGPNLTRTAINVSNYRGQNDQPFGKSFWMFDTDGGVDKYFNFGGLQTIMNAYEGCGPVFSIINKQVMAFTNGKTKIVKINGQDKGKEAQGEWANKIRNLMRKPNPLQNWKQFEAQAMVYMRLFGYVVVMPIKPAGFPNEDATQLWVIPPYMCSFKFSKQSYFNLKDKGWIESVTISFGDEKTVITDMDRLIIFKDITPGSISIALPGSPIPPIKENINNLMGIYESKGVLINYRGALGILSPEVDPAGAITPDPKEQAEMEAKLMGYGLKRGQAKFILANTAMKWEQMGVPYRDLMLTEWGEDDTMVVCDVLNFPFKLLANTKSSSMNGTEVDSFKKLLYVDFEIPFSEMWYEQWAEVFNADKNNCAIVKDFSHVSVLQEDGLKCAQTLKMRNEALQVEFFNNEITLNEWREANNRGKLESEHGDKFYSQLVEAGWVFGSGSGAPPKEEGTKEEEAKTPKASQKEGCVVCPHCDGETENKEEWNGLKKCEHCNGIIKINVL